MRRLGLFIFVFVFVFVFVFAGVGASLSAHLKVDRTSPATSGVMAEPPKLIQVWFTEAPTLAVSAIVLEGTAGKVELGKLALGKVKGTTDKSIVCDIVGTIAPGKYTVNWKTSGADGHILTGTFVFTVKARPAGPTSTGSQP